MLIQGQRHAKLKILFCHNALSLLTKIMHLSQNKLSHTQEGRAESNIHRITAFLSSASADSV